MVLAVDWKFRDTDPSSASAFFCGRDSKEEEEKKEPIEGEHEDCVLGWTPVGEGTGGASFMSLDRFEELERQATTSYSVRPLQLILNAYSTAVNQLLTERKDEAEGDGPNRGGTAGHDDDGEEADTRNPPHQSTTVNLAEDSHGRETKVKQRFVEDAEFVVWSVLRRAADLFANRLQSLLPPPDEAEEGGRVEAREVGRDANIEVKASEMKEGLRGSQQRRDAQQSSFVCSRRTKRKRGGDLEGEEALLVLRQQQSKRETTTTAPQMRMKSGTVAGQTVLKTAKSDETENQSSSETTQKNRNAVWRAAAAKQTSKLRRTSPVTVKPKIDDLLCPTSAGSHAVTGPSTSSTSLASPSFSSLPNLPPRPALWRASTVSRYKRLLLLGKQFWRSTLTLLELYRSHSEFPSLILSSVASPQLLHWLLPMEDQTYTKVMRMFVSFWSTSSGDATLPDIMLSSPMSPSRDRQRLLAFVCLRNVGLLWKQPDFATPLMNGSARNRKASAAVWRDEEGEEEEGRSATDALQNKLSSRARRRAQHRDWPKETKTKTPLRRWQRRLQMLSSKEAMYRASAKLQTLALQMYKAFSSLWEAVERHSWQSYNVRALLINCYCEFLNLDCKMAYRVAFLAIRQLAVAVRNLHMAMARKSLEKETNETKEKIRRLANAVYSWSFLRCCELWVSVCIAPPQVDEELPLLLHPLSMVVTAALKTSLDSATHAPFSCHCLDLLCQLSRQSCKYTPLSCFILGLVDSLAQRATKLRRSLFGASRGRSGGVVPSPLSADLPLHAASHRRRRKARCASEVLGQLKNRGQSEKTESRLVSKVVDVKTVIRLPAAQLQNPQVYESLEAWLISEILTLHLGLLSQHPSFPEVSVPVVTHLKKLTRSSKNNLRSPYLRDCVKRLVALCAQSSTAIAQKRQLLTVSAVLSEPKLNFFDSKDIPLAKHCEELIAKADVSLRQKMSDEAEETRARSRRDAKATGDDTPLTPKQLKRRRQKERRLREAVADKKGVDASVKKRRLTSNTNRASALEKKNEEEDVVEDIEFSSTDED